MLNTLYLQYKKGKYPQGDRPKAEDVERKNNVCTRKEYWNNIASKYC